LEVTMRRGVIAIVALVSACAFPGRRPEGRELRSTGEISAEQAAVYNRIVAWFGSRYTVVANQPSFLIRAERRVDNESVNLIEARLTARGPARTVLTLTGWTDILSGNARRKADVYSESLRADVTALQDHLSCAIARWAGCP
jgi:hypothetical protein